MGIKNKNNNYIVDIINFAAERCPEVLIRESEAIYHAQVFHAVLSAGEKQLVFLSGPSASGKTTTAGKVKEEMRHIQRSAAIVSLDDFYCDRDKLPIVDGKPNAEVVEALDVGRIYAALESIVSTGKAKLPRFDFVSGKRTDDAYELDIGKEGVLIVEGLHALNPLLSENLDASVVHKIYVSPHSGFWLNNHDVITKRELRFLRRMVRDSWSRGSDPTRTFSMWDDVCRGEDEFIRPLGREADSTIDTTHAYEPLVLKEPALKLLNSLPAGSPYARKAKDLSDCLEAFSSLTPYQIPTTSMLNEFIPV